jgi:hypothetical protein
MDRFGNVTGGVIPPPTYTALLLPDELAADNYDVIGGC